MKCIIIIAYICLSPLDRGHKFNRLCQRVNVNSQSSLWKGRETGSEVKVIDPNILFLTIKYEIQEENSKKTYATQTGLNSEATNKLISQEIILSC